MKLIHLLLAGALITNTACIEDKNRHSEHMTVKISAREMKFDPEELHVKAGQQIVLQFRNEGTVIHDWNAPGLKPDPVPEIRENDHTSRHGEGATHNDHHHAVNENQVHVMALPGKNSLVGFTPSGPGIYDFFCSVPGHREAGMIGRIRVH